MSTKKESVNILDNEQTRSKFLEGAKAAYDAVVTTYGPRGMNVSIEKSFGRPVVTRDGVTVARAVFFSDRPKNMGAQAIIEASETTNRIAGDATTATVALSYHLLKNSVQAIAAGVHPMEVSSLLKEDNEKMLAHLDKLAKPINDKTDQLTKVATVSSGDPLLGQLIAETIKHVGADGGIITEKAPIDTVEREYIDGYYLQSGFTALQAGKKELQDCAVVVAIKSITSKADAYELLTNVAKATGLQQGQILRVLFIGNIEGEAYNLIVDNVNRGTVDAIVVKSPPAYGQMAKELLEDIAMYVGCRPISDVTNIRQFDESYIGTVSRVVATKHDSTIFSDEQSENVETRIAELKEAIKSEVSDQVAEKLRDRVSKLEGKVAIFRIGAPTDSAKEELEFRVEDAINATRAAAEHGVVAGGGVTLLELSRLDISDITKKSLRSVFKRLLINANLPAEVKLYEAIDAPYGQGYNLRKDDKLVDVIAEGIIDPKLAVEQVVTNSISVIANLTTVGRSIVFTDDEVK